MKTFALSSFLVLASSSAAVAEPVQLESGDVPLRRALLVTAVAADEPAPLPAMPPPRAERERTIFGLPKNVGPVDRVIRTVVGTALLGVGIWGLSSDAHLSNTTSGILMGVSAIPFATAATGYCPIYQVIGIDRTF